MTQIKFFKKATAPATIETGNIWFDTTTQSIKVKTATGYDVFGIGLKDAILDDSILTITKSDNSTVTVDFSDIASASSVVEALALKADKTYVDGELAKKVDKVEGKGLSTNDYTTAEKNKLAGVAAGAQVNVIESVSVNGAALTVADKAVDITVPAATVTGVDSADKVLSLSGKLVKSEVGLAYDSSTKKINLTGKAGAVIASVDATSFIKDGMLESAELAVNPAGQTAGTYLVLTFNTDSESDPIYVNVSSLIDVYTAGNGITITGKQISVNSTVINNLIDTKVQTLDKEDKAVAGKVVSAVSETNGIITVSRRALVAADIPTLSVAKLSDLDATKIDLSEAYAAATIYTAPAAGDTVEAAIGKLAKGVVDATAAGVTSFGGKTGAITVRGGQAATAPAVNLSMSNNELQAAVVGVATSAQGNKADSALQTVSASGTAPLTLSASKTGTNVTVSGSVAEMKAATASAAGSAGIVPAPAAGKQASFLRGDGTWAVPTNTNTTYTFANGTAGNFTVTPSIGTAQTVSVGKPATAGTADKVGHALTLTVAGGSTEGTSKYTFDGSAGKALNIVAGSNVTLTPAAGQLTIAATDTKYTHPVGKAPSKASGFYKFSTDSTSHIASVTAVAKADITGLIGSGTYDAYGAATTAETNAKTYADSLMTWAEFE